MSSPISATEYIESIRFIINLLRKIGHATSDRKMLCKDLNVILFKHRQLKTSINDYILDNAQLAAWSDATDSLDSIAQDIIPKLRQNQAKELNLFEKTFFAFSSDSTTSKIDYLKRKASELADLHKK